jgi:hypothetical protein
MPPRPGRVDEAHDGLQAEPVIEQDHQRAVTVLRLADVQDGVHVQRR